MKTTTKKSTRLIGYVSSDGENITTWHGEPIARVTRTRLCQLPRWSWIHGKKYYSYRAQDSAGRIWWGRSSPGIAITLRPAKK